MAPMGQRWFQHVPKMKKSVIQDIQFIPGIIFSLKDLYRLQKFPWRSKSMVKSTDIAMFRETEVLDLYMNFGPLNVHPIN